MFLNWFKTMLKGFWSRFDKEKKDRAEKQARIIIIDSPPKSRLLIAREIYSNQTTIGKLYLNNHWFNKIWTLEDTVRKEGKKIQGKTAIPAGQYKVILRQSPSYHRIMPYLTSNQVGIAGTESEGRQFLFTNVMIHWGNFEADTMGCPLVGKDKGVDAIYRSKIAFNELMPEIETICKKENLYLEIH